MGELICGCVTFRSHDISSSVKYQKSFPTNNTMKPVSIILVLAVTVSLGNALDCHVCSSQVDPDCNKYDDEGNFLSGDKFLKTCDGGKDKYCRKIYQMIRDEESVVRSCGWEEHPQGYECYTTVLEEYNTEVCSCSEDGCNSADSVSSMSLATAVLTAALAHLYGRRF